MTCPSTAMHDKRMGLASAFGNEEQRDYLDAPGIGRGCQTTTLSLVESHSACFYGARRMRTLQ